jgi:hypothetical protein
VKASFWFVFISVLSMCAAGLLRYGLVEPGVAAEQGPLMLWLRTTTIALFTHERLGWVAVGSALLSVLRPAWQWPAYLCAVAGGFGLVLYNAELSAPALLVAGASLAVLPWNTPKAVAPQQAANNKA